MLTYTADELRQLKRDDVTPSRLARKAIFRHRLWLPRFQRQSLLRRQRRVFPDHSSIDTDCLQLGCINARLIANRSASIHDIVSDNKSDILVITETWHECSDSVDLKRLTPPGYQCIDAARPLRPGMSTYS